MECPRRHRLLSKSVIWSVTLPGCSVGCQVLVPVGVCGNFVDCQVPGLQVMAVEVLWTPEDEDDTYSRDEMLLDYPSLNNL